MLSPASPEFVSLCQSQATLLSEGFGAAVSAVYVTNDLAAEGQSKLIPIVVYPEEAAAWLNPQPLSLPAQVSPSWQEAEGPDLESASEALSLSDVPFNFDAQTQDLDRSAPPLFLYHPQRILLPLLQEERMRGLLVVVRDTQKWTPQEQTQLEEVADTLAIAWVLDQRSQWLMQMNYQHRALQGERHENLANLLHQFRNPLTTLRTLGKLLLKRLHPGDSNQAVAQSIVQQSDRLEELLQQFDGAIEPIDLGAAALESATHPPPTADGNLTPKAFPPATQPLDMDLKLQPCWIVDILKPLLQSIVGIEEERHLSVLTEIAPELSPIQADATALREVLSNLIDNALKYTPSGGEIRIQVRRQAESNSGNLRQQVWVSDSGPGIPAPDLERVFDRHYRGIQAQTEIPGTGLGLGIARDLMAQMQGQLQAYSPAIDQPPSANGDAIAPGSTFVVTVPEYEPSTL